MVNLGSEQLMTVISKLQRIAARGWYRDHAHRIHYPDCTPCYHIDDVADVTPASSVHRPYNIAMN
jgi:hypothetical protein